MSDSESRFNKEKARVGLPTRPFLYTVDQVAGCLEVSTRYVTSSLAFFEGRSIGLPGKDRIVFRNIAPEGEKPEWRCAESDFMRWMRRKGFQFYREWITR